MKNAESQRYRNEGTGCGGSRTKATISVLSAPIALCPVKNTTPFGGGCLKYFSRDRIDSIAPWTCFRVLCVLMFELCEYSPRR